MTEPTFCRPFSVTSLHSAENSAFWPWKFSNSNSSAWTAQRARGQLPLTSLIVLIPPPPTLPSGTLNEAPAPPWLLPAASCSGALCCSDILLIPIPIFVDGAAASQRWGSGGELSVTEPDRRKHDGVVTCVCLLGRRGTLCSRATCLVGRAVREPRQGAYLWPVSGRNSRNGGAVDTASMSPTLCPQRASQWAAVLLAQAAPPAGSGLCGGEEREPRG